MPADRLRFGKVAHAGEEEEQRHGGGNDPTEGPPPRPWGRILVAGAIGAALALAGIAADAFL